MKKGLLILGGLLATISLCSCDKQVETKIEYVDRVVEVEKTTTVEVPVEKIVEVEKIIEKEIPIEVEKVVTKTVMVEVPVEKVVEVEKIVYVEKSVATIDGMNVTVLGDNLYQIEFEAGILKGNIAFEYIDKTPIDILEQRTYDSKLYLAIKELLNLIQFKNSGEGEIVTKPGYIIKDIVLANPRMMGKPYVLDNDYNNILPSNIDNYPRNIASLKYEYSNLNKEQLHIVFNKGYGLEHTYDSVGLVRITFSIRK